MVIEILLGSIIFGIFYVVLAKMKDYEWNSGSKKFENSQKKYESSKPWDKPIWWN